MTPAAGPITAVAKLVSANDLSDRTGIPASWFEAQARERRIPFRKIGRYVRFDFEEILACDAFQRRAVPRGDMNCTGSNDRRAPANG
jgi:hypothetical protein